MINLAYDSQNFPDITSHISSLNHYHDENLRMLGVDDRCQEIFLNLGYDASRLRTTFIHQNKSDKITEEFHEELFLTIKPDTREMMEVLETVPIHHHYYEDLGKRKFHIAFRNLTLIGLTQRNCTVRALSYSALRNISSENVTDAVVRNCLRNRIYVFELIEILFYIYEYFDNFVPTYKYFESSVKKCQGMYNLFVQFFISELLIKLHGQRQVSTSYLLDILESDVARNDQYMKIKYYLSKGIKNNRKHSEYLYKNICNDSLYFEKENQSNFITYLSTCKELLKNETLDCHTKKAFIRNLSDISFYHYDVFYIYTRPVYELVDILIEGNGREYYVRILRDNLLQYFIDVLTSFNNQDAFLFLEFFKRFINYGLTKNYLDISGLGKLLKCSGAYRLAYGILRRCNSDCGTIILDILRIIEE